MKRVFSTFIALLFVAFGYSQDYPAEWKRFMSDRYLYSVVTEYNTDNVTQKAFRTRLTELATTSLARHIQMHVTDNATMNKMSIDGNASVNYISNTSFSTDLNLKLVNVAFNYDPEDESGAAMAYICKPEVEDYYKKELDVRLAAVNQKITLARNYISTGYKAKAKEELNGTGKYFETVEEALFWLNVFECPHSEMIGYQKRFNQCEETVKGLLSELEHGTVIFLSCKADIFGEQQSSLQNEIKGILSRQGCSFTTSPSGADWVIYVSCSAREYSVAKIGNTVSYFSYIDAEISIDKVITGQRIYEDAVSVKGGHPLNYKMAAKAAIKDLKEQVSQQLLNTINQ